MNTFSIEKQYQLLDELTRMSTESQNKDTLDIDLLDAQGILEKINAEDQKVANVVRGIIPEIAHAVDEIVHAFKDCNHTDLPYKIVGRRPGDIATSYADVSKANNLLNWKAELTINEMVVDAWNFENKHAD